MTDSESGTQEKRGGKPRAVGAMLGKVTRASLGKRGFAEASVITDWPEIVGGLLADQTCPTRIAYQRGKRGEGTLHLRAASSAIATEVQHLAPLIVERINTHFGYRAVARLRITSGPLPPRRPRGPKAKPGPLPADLAETLTSIADPDLKRALEALARHLG